MTPYEERLCRTCQYGKKSEYQKPCVVYWDDCQLYRPIKEMTPENFIENTVVELQIKMRETEEEFVYELIRPYSEEIIEKRLSKEEQEPCDDCVYSTKDGYCQYDDITEAISPLEPCEDCISRQDTIDAIYKKHIGGKDAVENAPINDLYACGLEDAVDAVENMPPVTPQPKRGH